MRMIEIHANDINDDIIEAQIIQNINDRKKAGAYSEDEVRELSKPLDGQYSCNDEKSGSLFYLNSHWHLINDNHVIKSNIPVIGKILVAVRKLLYGEIRRCTDPLFLKETEFNRHVANALNDISKKLKEDFSNEEIGTEIKNYIDLKFDQTKRELLLEIQEEYKNVRSDSKSNSENSNISKSEK